jgi:hypothetical protein
MSLTGRLYAHTSTPMTLSDSIRCFFKSNKTGRIPATTPISSTESEAFDLIAHMDALIQSSQTVWEGNQPADEGALNMRLGRNAVSVTRRTWHTFGTRGRCLGLVYRQFRARKTDLGSATRHCRSTVLPSWVSVTDQFPPVTNPLQASPPTSSQLRGRGGRILVICTEHVHAPRQRQIAGRSTKSRSQAGQETERNENASCSSKSDRRS